MSINITGVIFVKAITSFFQMAPIFFDYERTPMGLKKVRTVLDTFNSILEKQGTKYCAGGILCSIFFFFWYNVNYFRIIYINKYLTSTYH